MFKNNPYRWLPWALLGLLVAIFLCFIGFLVLNGLSGMAGEALDKARATQAANGVELTAYAIRTTATAAAPAATPIPILAPTLVPATPIPATVTAKPTIAPTPTYANPFAWVGADTPYKNETVMTGGKTFKGPGVCEWWDQKGFAFEATYNRQKDEVKTFELHEGMFFLTSGYSYTYPEGYVGKCWNVENDAAVAKLSTSYRHLLFFSNIYGNDSAQIKVLKSRKYIWDGLVVEGKGQHLYMHAWLETNDLGSCDFINDQRGCKYLALVVVQVPLGTTIK